MEALQGKGGVTKREAQARPRRGPWARGAALHCRGPRAAALGQTEFFFFQNFFIYSFHPFFTSHSFLHSKFPSLQFSYYQKCKVEVMIPPAMETRDTTTFHLPNRGDRVRNRCRGNIHPNTGVSPPLISRGTWVVPNRGWGLPAQYGRDQQPFSTIPILPIPIHPISSV